MQVAAYFLFYFFAVIALFVAHIMHRQMHCTGYIKGRCEARLQVSSLHFFKYFTVSFY